MATKYRRKVMHELIDKSRAWNAQGCNSWSLSNVGNVNVTINKVIILEPGEDWEGPFENPEIIDYTDLDIEFDVKNDPTGFAPIGGTNPTNPIYLPGDPAPPRDHRLVITKSFITET